MAETPDNPPILVKTITRYSTHGRTYQDVKTARRIWGRKHLGREVHAAIKAKYGSGVDGLDSEQMAAAVNGEYVERFQHQADGSCFRPNGKCGPRDQFCRTKWHEECDKRGQLAELKIVEKKTKLSDLVSHKGPSPEPVPPADTDKTANCKVFSYAGLKAYQGGKDVTDEVFGQSTMPPIEDDPMFIRKEPDGPATATDLERLIHTRFPDLVDNPFGMDFGRGNGVPAMGPEVPPPGKLEKFLTKIVAKLACKRYEEAEWAQS